LVTEPLQHRVCPALDRDIVLLHACCITPRKKVS